MGRRRHFTIVELFICLALLTVMGSVLAVKSYSLIQDHRFSSGAKAVQSKVDALRTMSLIYEAEVKLNLVFEEGELVVSSFTHERFPLVDKDVTLKCSALELNGKEIEKGEVIIRPTPLKTNTLILFYNKRQVSIKF